MAAAQPGLEVFDELQGRDRSNEPAVPIGGQRVPKGMEDHANWRDLPEQEVVSREPASYGEEYLQIHMLRTNLGELKKALSDIPKITANILRLRDEASGAADAGKLAHEQATLDAAIASLRKMSDLFPAGSPYRAIIDDIAQQALPAKPFDKESHFQFASNVKVASTTVFRDHGKLLQQLKEIKKRVEAAEKAAGKS